MTEQAGTTFQGDGRSAGQVLREARVAKGLAVSALAAQLRVSTARLEALEGDQIDDLHGAAYTRSLALAVCRSLGIDPAPVLQRLPVPDDSSLGAVGPGLNTPFREGPTGVRGRLLHAITRPIVWGPALFLVASALLWWWPQVGAMPGVTTVAVTPPTSSPPSASEPAAPSTSAIPPVAAVAAAPTVETVHSSPPQVEASPVDPSRPLQLRVAAESWIEVLDARGIVLLSRTLQAGEQVGLAGSLPLQVRIGNAAQTTVQWRGQPVELGGYTRDNVARLELR